MIINKLSLTAFGPYKGREEIDFQPLNEAKLFAVCGSTGAGKTAIFDGISYAVYGKASGISRKEPETLRCVMADDSTFTEVMLEFTLKEQRYRVRRQMPHVKEGNKNPSGGAVELHQWHPEANEGNGAWVDILKSGKSADINKRLTQIIGLDADQFRQIVMLPQGEFEKLLLADSTEKEKILRQIFDTNRYNAMTESLKKKAGNLQKEYNQCRQNVKALEGALEKTMEPFPEAGVLEVLHQEDYNEVQVLSALIQDLDTLEKREKELADSLQGEKEKQTLLQAKQLQAEQDNKALEKLQETREKMKEIKAVEKDMLQLKYQLEAASKALRIAPLYHQLKGVVKNLAEKEKVLVQAKEAHKKAEECHQLADEQWKKAQDIKPELLEKQTLMHQLKGYLPQVKELAQAKEILVSTEKKLVDLKKQATTLRKKETGMETSLQKLSDEQETLNNAFNNIQTLYEDKENQTKKQGLLKRISELGVKIDQQKKRAEEWEREFLEKKTDYLELEKNWMAGQAAILASRLEEGQPCPVCGSQDHPVKASEEENAPSKEQLDEMRSLLDKTTQANIEAGAQLKHLEEQWQTQVEELKTLTITQDPVDIQALSKEVGERLKGLGQQFLEMEQKKKRLAAVKTEIKELLGLKEEVKGKLEEAAEREKEYQNLMAGNEKVVLLVEGQVPKAYQNAVHLQQKLEELDHWTKTQEKKLTQAKDAVEEWQKTVIQCKSTHENAAKNLEELKAQREKLGQNWEESRTMTGFESDEGFLEASMPEEWVTGQEQTLKEYWHLTSVTETTLQELEKNLEGKEWHDVAELMKEVAEQTAKVDALGKDLLQYRNLHKTATSLLQHLEKGAQETEAAEVKWKKVYRLYSVASGSINDKRLALETYVQQHYFGQILEHANHRLHDLTQGQYLLVPDEEREKRGKKSGLGIDVYDSYTDSARSTKTLSGGEKFNASLCLALGMYDVIQSNSGGTEMNTMFIDEGFGSLDPQEALPKAVQMLVDMQEAGRVVGVISHVSEMREQLSALLEVEKGTDGISKTRITLKN